MYVGASLWLRSTVIALSIPKPPLLLLSSRLLGFISRIDKEEGRSYPVLLCCSHFLDPGSTSGCLDAPPMRLQPPVVGAGCSPACLQLTSVSSPHPKLSVPSGSPDAGFQSQPHAGKATFLADQGDWVGRGGWWQLQVRRLQILSNCTPSQGCFSRIGSSQFAVCLCSISRALEIFLLFFQCEYRFFISLV